jgi:hypothetical protein
MIDHTMLKPAAAVVLAGAAAAALTVGQSAFAIGPAAARARAAPAACNASDQAIYTPPASVSGAPGTLLACDHILTDNEAIGDVIGWLGDRFAGKPTAGNC